MATDALWVLRVLPKSEDVEGLREKRAGDVVDIHDMAVVPDVDMEREQLFVWRVNNMPDARFAKIRKRVLSNRNAAKERQVISVGPYKTRIATRDYLITEFPGQSSKISGFFNRTTRQVDLPSCQWSKWKNHLWNFETNQAATDADMGDD